jgi:tetratricopeptide (TPR) repeat protein
LKKLWRSLAVFPNTFADSAVAALWELSIEDAQDRLAELISYSLIEWNETTRRYRLHDLVRLFADAHLGEQERLSAKKAHAVYFIKVLDYANKIYLQGNESITVGLALLDVERENIEAGQRWAASMIGKNETATQLSMVYYNAGAHVLDLRLYPLERIRWQETGLKAARLLGDRSAEGAALGSLGLSFSFLGEARKAIELYEKCLTITRETGDRYAEGIALNNLGLAYVDLDCERKAVEFFEQALIGYREVGDRRGESYALGNLGLAYSKLGETLKAIEFYTKRIPLSYEIGDHRGVGNLLSNLAAAYVDLGETHKAVEFYEQALNICREIGDRRNEGYVLGNLGTAYTNLDKFGRAIEFYEQCLMIAREIGDSRVEGTILWNSALAYDKLGDRTQAITLAEMALAILEQIESPAASKVRSALAEWKSEAS